MKKANAIFMILSGLLVLQNFLTAIGGMVMATEHKLTVFVLGCVPLIIWIAALILSRKKKDTAPVTLAVYVGLTLVLGIHFYLLTTDPSYGFPKIIEFFGA